MSTIAAVASQIQSPSATTLIEVRRLTKVHRRGTVEVSALRDVSCSIPAGAFTFILGPSGSGKSTLLYLLGGLDVPTSGEIWVNGRSLGSMTMVEQDRFRQQDVGFVFQNFNLLANLNAVENVLVPYFPQGIRPEQRTRAIELLKELGLGQRLDHRPAHMSGGEQQRVAIARALLKRPRLVLADEPTGELDTENSHAILNDLRQMCADLGTTVVIVTHEQEFVRPTDHVIRIRDGHCVG